MRNRFRTLSIVLHFLGSLLILLGGLLLLPLLVVVLASETSQGPGTLLAFLLPSALSFLLGGLLIKFFCGGVLDNLQAMLICGIGWLGCSAIGALPFVIALKTSYLNGFFETMSGFTTTGITMFTGLDQMPKSILFWRSFTQWLGGLGILTFFLAVTFGRGGVYRLFGAESHKIDVGRPVPGLANTLKILWSIYVGFTTIILLGLLLARMSFFDSLCHSFTALSTGGFSPHDASIEYYRLSGHPHFIWIEYILIIGMLMGGTNFIIHYRFLKGQGRALFDNMEMKYWWGFIAAFVIAILGERFLKMGTNNGISPDQQYSFKQIEENFRLVLFQVSSIITTTGFGTRDIGAPFFGQLARQLFLVMMVVGGCVGSTGGGFKMLRVGILMKLIRREIFRLRTPAGTVSTVIVDGKPVARNEVYRVAGLFFAWISLLVIGGCTTALFSRFDTVQSFSGMFSALGNIGPCFIPVPEMGQLQPMIKVVYIFGMLAGRLEILPILLLFSLKTWRS